MSRLLALLANLAWLASCLPATLAFRAALAWPEWHQRRLLRGMLPGLAASRYGREVCGREDVRTAEDLLRLPIADYDSLRPFVGAIQAGEAGVLTAEPVLVLQPTSGTGSSPKLIPFTRGLQRQFQAALAPWMAALFALRPRLLLGRQYWCLSPNANPAVGTPSAVPVGFANDADYLGGRARWFARHVFVAPDELAHVRDPLTFEFLTLLFLVRDENLRLISVWHPSFLTVLVEAFPRHAAALEACLRSGALPADLPIPAHLRASLGRHLRRSPGRAAAVARAGLAGPAGIRRLWPHLQVISCWTGREAEPWVARLKQWFPNAAIQGKGLLATEGAVTIPWGLRGRCVCAVRSHFLEFRSPDSDLTKRCWEVEPGQIYSVLITTAGGLWRYRLGDLVRVSGRVGRTPCLEFVGREGIVSDLCGEKLTLAEAESALEEARAATGVKFTFAMLVPERQGLEAGYNLLAEQPSGAPPAALAACGTAIEAALQKNFHYRHARRIGQLRPLQVHVIQGDAVRRYRAHLRRLGCRDGDIKFPALRLEAGWTSVLEVDGDHRPVD